VTFIFFARAILVLLLWLVGWVEFEGHLVIQAAPFLAPVDRERVVKQMEAMGIVSRQVMTRTRPHPPLHEALAPRRHYSSLSSQAS
jgi:hypothetical protein